MIKQHLLLQPVVSLGSSKHIVEKMSYNATNILWTNWQRDLKKVYFAEKLSKNCRISTKIQCVIDHNLVVNLVQYFVSFEPHLRKLIHKIVTNIVSNLIKLAQISVIFPKKIIENISDHNQILGFHCTVSPFLSCFLVNTTKELWYAHLSIDYPPADYGLSPVSMLIVWGELPPKMLLRQLENMITLLRKVSWYLLQPLDYRPFDYPCFKLNKVIFFWRSIGESRIIELNLALSLPVPSFTSP